MPAPRESAADLVPAIGYVRVSMAREDQISPETQQSAIEDAGRRRGYRIVMWVTDLDKTGRDFNRRIMAAIERVEAGRARTILVWKYSRFGRNRTGVAVNLARLENAGGELVSATEDVDAQTATGRFTRGMLFEVAAFESDRIGETWREAYDYRVSEGLPPLGRPRFGYERLGRVRDEDDPRRTRRDKSDPEPERYVPDPETGPLLAGMYAAYIRGDGGRVIAASLNARAVPTTYGNPWSLRAVLDVLDSGFGAGYLRVHDPACRCAKPGRCKNKVMVRGKRKRVILEEQWQAYRARRGQVQATPPRSRVPVYPVSGLVRCGHCGAALTVSGARKDGTLRFRCSRHKRYHDCPGGPSVPLAVLLDSCRDLLAEIAADLDAKAPVAKARARAARTARSAADKLGRQLADTDRKLANLAIQRAASGSVLPDSAWEQAAAELTAERAKLEERLSAATRESAVVSADPAPPLAALLDGWEILPAPDLNRMLRAVVRQVTVWRTGPAERDEMGHFLPQEVRVKVVPVWQTADGGTSVS